MGGSGSSPVLSVVLIVALIALIFALQSSVVRRKAARAIFSGTHRKGQEVARATQTFTVARSPGKVLEAIITEVNAFQSAPTVVGGLYLKGRGTSDVLFAFGSKLTDSFVAQVTLTSPDGAVTQGTTAVVNWTESEGLVDGFKQIERLRDRIARAVAQLGGTVHSDSSPLR